jgi:hypothetical protein
VSGPVDIPCALAVWGVFSAPPPVDVQTECDGTALAVPRPRKRVRRDPKDLTGKRVGALVVRGRAEVGSRISGGLWLLDCACGSTCTETADNLTRGARTCCSRACPMREAAGGVEQGGAS